MDVTCDKCRTEYEFDESLISESGTTVKCTNCGYLFRIYRPGTPDSKRRSAWMLRQPDGSVYTFERMTTLQRWIAEGKVSKDDMVSQNGDAWQALGSMQELVPFFRTAQAVRAAKGLEGSWTDDEEGPTVRIPPVRRQEQGRPEGGTARPDQAREPPRAPPPRAVTPSLGLPRAEPVAKRAAGEPAGPASHAPGEPLAPRRPVPPAPKAPKAPEPLGAVPKPQAPPKAAEPKAPEPPVPTTHEPPPPAQPASPPRPEEAPTLVRNSAVSTTLAGPPLREPSTEPPPPTAPQPKEDWSEGALLDGQSPAWAAAAKDRDQLASSEQEPAWTASRISQLGQEHATDEAPPARNRFVKIGIPLIAVGVVVCIGVAVSVLYPDLLKDLASQVVTVGGDQNDSPDDAYGFGREQFLLDTTEGFRQADREYHRGRTDGLVQAGLAEVYTTWSQYDLDDVADARLRAQKADPTRAVELETRAKVQEEEFRRKLEQALRFIDAALKRAPESVEAHRSAADYYRLAGDLEKAKQHIATALEHATKAPDALPETEYVKALVDLSLDGNVAAAVARLEGAIARNDKLIRCHYRLARLYAASGEQAKAVSNLEKIVALNAHHERAPTLLEALRGTEPVLVAVAATSAQIAPAAAADAGAPAADAGPAAAVVTPDAGPAIATPPAAATPPAEEPFDVMVRRATKLQSSGGSGEACALFRRADKIRAGNAEVLVGLGYCALDAGSSSQAMSLFQRALRGNANYGPALIALASTYRRQGNSSQALAYYRRYLQSNPSGPDASMARQNVERLEAQLGPSGDQGSADAAPQTDTQPPPPSGEPATTPPPPADSPQGTPENPSVTRITNEAPPEVHSDSLTTGSEPPLRPGEDLD